LENVIPYAVASLVGLLTLYYGVKAALEAIAKILPGRDFAEKAVDVMDEKIDPIVEKIDALVPGETPGAPAPASSEQP
jgi:hypothetical protein